MRTVAIVGTGLIGASFGLALRRAGFAAMRQLALIAAAVERSL